MLKFVINIVQKHRIFKMLFILMITKIKYFVVIPCMGFEHILLIPDELEVILHENKHNHEDGFINFEFILMFALTGDILTLIINFINRFRTMVSILSKLKK